MNVILPDIVTSPGERCHTVRIVLNGMAESV